VPLHLHGEGAARHAAIARPDHRQAAAPARALKECRKNRGVKLSRRQFLNGIAAVSGLDPRRRLLDGVGSET
jgi:hypothetical protein